FPSTKLILFTTLFRSPGSRKIAEELQVHRKTIVAALDELQEQGWVKTVPNIGTFVKKPEFLLPINSGPKRCLLPPEKAPFHFRKDRKSTRLNSSHEKI